MQDRARALAVQPDDRHLTTASPNLIGWALNALARWNPSETLPPGLSSTSLGQAIDTQRLNLRVPHDAEITLACKSLMVHAEAAGIAKPDPASLFTVWRTHCREMPASLLESGLARVLRDWKNTFCLPAPGAVWDEIEGELATMRSHMATLENAQRLTSDPAAYDPANRAPSAETDRVISETLAILRAAGARPRTRS